MFLPIRKIIFLSLLILLGSCAFIKNKKEVMIAIDSDPAGAKIYIDDKYYGDTVRQVWLAPDRDYNLRLTKEGYKTVNYVMKTKHDRRVSRNTEKRRCRSDFILSPLILPILSLNSVYCRDFEQRTYYFDLEVARGPSIINMGYQYVPSEYVPPQSEADSKRMYGNTTYYTMPVPVQPQMMQQVPQQAYSSSYSNPYQNYPTPPASGYAPQAYQQQAPMDFDSSYKAPTQTYQGQAKGGWNYDGDNQNFNNQPQPQQYYDEDSSYQAVPRPSQ